MAYLHKERNDQIVVVGNGPVAVAWTVALRRLVSTVLVTPTKYIYDPFFPAALVAGYPVDAFRWEIGELVPRDAYRIADPVDIRDGAVTVRFPDGVVQTVGCKAVLCTPPCGLYDGNRPGGDAIVHGRPVVGAIAERRFVERLLGSDAVTVLGRPASALALALELSTRSDRARIRFSPTCVDNSECVDAATTRLWRHANRPVDELGVTGRDAVTAPAVDAAPPRSERATVVSLGVIPRGESRLDRFSRIGPFERVFGLPDDELVPPRGALFTNLLTCAFATGRFPLTFQRNRLPPVRRPMRLYVSRETRSAAARSAMARVGSICSRRRVLPLERRMRALRSFLMQLPVTEEVATV